MISAITIFEARPFDFGGAVRLLWVNPSDATFDHVIILRKATNDISGPTDPAAILVNRGIGKQAEEFRSVFLPNDITSSDLYRTILDDGIQSWASTIYYKIFASNADESDISTASVIAVSLPQVSTFEEFDVIGSLLTFIKSYLKQQIVTGALRLPVGKTDIDVIDGPPLLDAISFPIVSLHLDQDQPIGFSIGDNIGHMDEDGDDTVLRRGFMSNVTIAVVGVTDNPEIRRLLYRALKGALIAGRQLMEQHGMLNMELSGRFNEDFINYDMPLFSAEMTLRGSIATSVMVPPQQGIIGTIDTNEATLTATTIVA